MPKNGPNKNNSNNSSNQSGGSEPITLIALPDPNAPAAQKAITEYERDLALWEDASEYQAHCIAVHEDYPSKGIVERHLVDQIAQLTWRQKRCANIEASIFASARYRSENAFGRESESVDVVERFLSETRLLSTMELAQRANAIVKVCGELPIPYFEKCLEPLENAKFQGELDISRPIPDMNRVLYKELLGKVEGLSPLIIAKWKEALAGTYQPRITLLSGENRFLRPYWLDQRTWDRYEDEMSAETIETDDWSWEENVLDLATFIIEVAFVNFRDWVVEDRENKRVALGVHQNVERINAGNVINDWTSKLSDFVRYEEHLRKSLLDILNAYFIVRKQSQALNNLNSN